MSDDQLIWAPSPAYHLVPTSFEAGLTERPLFDADGEVAVHVPEEVLFDLGAVGWIDVGALVQFVLIVDAVHRSGRSVSVALPYEADLRHPTPDLEPSPPIGKKTPLQRRVDAVGYLATARFAEALAGGPFAGRPTAVHLVAGRDPSAPGRPAAPPRHRPRRSTPTYKNLLPLTWVGDPKDPQVARYAEMTADMITEDGIDGSEGSGDVADRGRLSTVDAADLSAVVMFEFVKNVVDHAGVDMALVMAWPRPAQKNVRGDEVLASEGSYVGWLTNAGIPTAEVVVGDSGRGLARSLRSAYEAETSLDPSKDDEVALWAFERWSTRTDRDASRGTRGLYRVDRVAIKHAGLVTVRTSRSFVGKVHDSAAVRAGFYHRSELADVPGTVLRVRLPPFRQEVVRPSAPRGAPFVLEFASVALPPLGDSGLTDEASRILFQAVTSHREPRGLLVEIGGGSRDPRAIEAAINQVARLRAPHPIVLTGFAADWDKVAEACHHVCAAIPFNQNVEATAHDRYTTFDPVLVLGAALDEWQWSGTTDEVALVLNRLTATEHGTLSLDAVRQLVPDAAEFELVLKALRLDHAIVELDHHSVRLRLTVSTVTDGVSELVQRGADDALRRSEEGGRQTYLTPSLRYVRHWFDPRTSVSSWCTPRFLALAVADRLKLPEGSAPIVVADGNTNEIAGHLRTALGGSRVDLLPSEVASEEPEGLQRYDAGATVLVFVDILVSGQSVRRAIEQIRRSGARPVALFSLLDAREEGAVAAPPTVGMREISLAAIDLDAPAVPDPHIIDPSQRSATSSEHQYDYALTGDDLRQLVRESGALQLGHWGSAGGRHFTFYLDAASLLQQRTLVDGVAGLVGSWLGEAPDGHLELWHPEPEQRVAKPGQTLANELRAGHPTATVRSVSRRGSRPTVASGEPARGDGPLSVVILDWGAITGTTVFSMLSEAVQAGASRVLVCLLLNQLPADIASFMTRLRSLSDPSQGSGTPGAATTGPPSMTVDIRFLAPFPIAGYESNCPVCQRLARLPIDTSRLPTLIDDEQRRVKREWTLRPREDVASVTGDARSTEHQVRLLETMALRSRIQTTLSSTRARLAFVEWIELQAALLEGTGHGGPAATEEKRSEALDHALDLVRLLSAEPHWIMKPPLVIDRARSVLIRIARLVAVDPRCDSRERADATVILRIASQEAFAHAVTEIFGASRDDREIHGALFHGAYTMLTRGYVDADSVTPLASAIAQLKKQTDQLPHGSSTDVKAALDRLDGVAQMRDRRAQIAGLSPCEAWRGLVELLDKEFVPHEFEALERMDPSNYVPEVAEVIANGSTASAEVVTAWSEELSDEWRDGSSDFMNDVAPRLSLITRELSGRDAGRVLSSAGRFHLLNLVESSDAEHTVFGEFLVDVAEGSRPLIEESVWKDYGNLYDDVVRKLITTGEPSRTKPTRLVQFLRSLPCDIVAETTQVARRFERAMNISLDVSDAEQWAYAPAALAHDIISTFLANIQQRTTSEGGRPDVQISVTSDADHVILRVVNDRTDPSLHFYRRDLAGLRDRIGSFGGSIPRATRSARWTFEIEARFVAWPATPDEPRKDHRP
ncbi:MAG TPA: hypothetical protein VNS19_03345 [Acidimicrobiales bacterium]|nr:hypothetical protein [Acidimicrobiales bacterium]